VILLTMIWILYVSGNTGTFIDQAHQQLVGYTTYDRCRDAGDTWVKQKNTPKDRPRTYSCELTEEAR
jgi:hypothetical protein